MNEWTGPGGSLSKLTEKGPSEVLSLFSMNRLLQKEMANQCAKKKTGRNSKFGASTRPLQRT